MNVGVQSVARCRPGDVATGGGYDTVGLVAPLNVIENKPIPTGPGAQSGPATGWVTHASVGVLGGGFRAYVMCDDL
ncbi:hypothetical protein [Streptomyces pacificus]|uniref:hypothetical protein n=1 Tax=Streptomyces pacificus TaxID=2705029 RepID=UPI001C2099AA|nr:hypothetical protein [Streptomyces pacificus]